MSWVRIHLPPFARLVRDKCRGFEYLGHHCPVSARPMPWCVAQWKSAGCTLTKMAVAGQFRTPGAALPLNHNAVVVVIFSEAWVRTPPSPGIEPGSPQCATGN